MIILIIKGTPRHCHWELQFSKSEENDPPYYQKAGYRPGNKLTCKQAVSLIKI